jgi:uncharacterized protein (DUF1778 family)
MKDVIGIRLEPDEREALREAAAADDRSISALARKIIVAWLNARRRGEMVANGK